MQGRRQGVEEFVAVICVAPGSFLMPRLTHAGTTVRSAQGTQPFDEAINADMTSDRGSMLNILTLVGNFPGMIALRALQNGNKG